VRSIDRGRASMGWTCDRWACVLGGARLVVIGRFGPVRGARGQILSGSRERAMDACGWCASWWYGDEFVCDSCGGGGGGGGRGLW
jgi:hypothetical protein